MLPVSLDTKSKEGGSEDPPPFTASTVLDLPGTAGLAATLARACAGAGAGGRAVGVLEDRERVARLRARHDRVALGRRRANLDVTGARAKREAGGAEAGRVGAASVVLLVGEARLDLGNEVTCVRLTV